MCRRFTEMTLSTTKILAIATNAIKTSYIGSTSFKRKRHPQANFAGQDKFNEHSNFWYEKELVSKN